MKKNIFPLLGLLVVLVLSGAASFNRVKASDPCSSGEFTCTFSDPGSSTTPSDCPTCTQSNTPSQSGSSSSGNTPSNQPATTGNTPSNLPAGSGSGSGAAAGTSGSADTSGSPCQYNNQSNKICNPLGYSDLVSFVIHIIKYLLDIIGVIAVLAVVYAGFRLVTSMGNEKTYGEARKILIYAVSGLLLASLAYTIIAIIDNALK